MDNSVYNPCFKTAYKRFTLPRCLREELVREQGSVRYSFPLGVSNENRFLSQLFRKKQKEFFFLPW